MEEAELSGFETVYSELLAVLRWMRGGRGIGTLEREKRDDGGDHWGNMSASGGERKWPNARRGDTVRLFTNLVVWPTAH